MSEVKPFEDRSYPLDILKMQLGRAMAPRAGDFMPLLPKDAGRPASRKPKKLRLNFRSDPSFDLQTGAWMFFNVN